MENSQTFHPFIITHKGLNIYEFKRHSQLCADMLLSMHGREVFSWGVYPFKDNSFGTVI